MIETGTGITRFGNNLTVSPVDLHRISMDNEERQRNFRIWLQFFVPTIQRESVLNGCLSSLLSTVVAIEHNFLTSLSQAFFHEHYIIRLLLYSCQQVVVYTSVTK